MDGFLRNFHNQFMQEFRTFCVEMCQKFQKTVDNPSLTNILSLMTMNFCIKAFQYFSNSHKNILQRMFSVINKCINFVLQESSDEDKTIEQKEKLTRIVEGLINASSFIFKIITDKVNDLIEMKEVYETTDIV